jgi:hypothetical protein
MSASNEGQPYWHPKLGDLKLWYQTFLLFAATSPADDPYFHGPHVASPVDLDRLVSTLEEFEKKYPVEDLPTLEYMRAELEKRAQVGNGAGPAADSGSPCHNFWHWLNGD